MRYVALLRGINVGGNNRVPMPELRACFEAAGYENVKTYINSGNVIFDSDEADLEKLVTACELGIENDSASLSAYRSYRVSSSGRLLSMRQAGGIKILPRNITRSL